MSDKNINQMYFKELRNEVQLLRDELAIMQRKYEDILYNLDTENFSSKLTKELTSKVSTDEVESIVSQTAEELSTQIKSVDGRISSVRQTVNSLSSTVEGLDGLSSTFEQTAYGFTLDGEKTTFTGVIFLTDNAKNKRFSIFFDETQGYEQVIIHSVTNTVVPVVIGDSADSVYLSQVTDDNKIATHGWVNKNSVAKFG